jgi:NDP-sugar pyrophosphorylase family protein
MQAVVLAAGAGTRLTPLTAVIPKALIPIANKPILDYVIDSLEQAGIKEIMVVTGHLGTNVMQYLETSRKRRKLAIHSTHAHDYNAGSLYSLLASEKFVTNDFLLVPADMIIKPRIIKQLVNRHTQIGKVDIPVSELKPNISQRTFVVNRGESESRSEKVPQFLEPNTLGNNSKNSEMSILGAALGIVVCPKEIFKYIHNAAREGFSRVTDVLNRYIADGGLAGLVNIDYNDCWFDLDTIQTLLEANRFVLRDSTIDKEVGQFYPEHVQSVGKGQSAGAYYGSDIRVIGPSIIGKDCIVESKSKIGPYVSIQDNCIIGRHVTCRNAIFLSGSRVGDNSAIKNAVFYDNRTILSTNAT